MDSRIYHTVSIDYFLAYSTSAVQKYTTPESAYISPEVVLYADTGVCIMQIV